MTSETIDILKREISRCTHDELIGILTDIAPTETRKLSDGTRKVVVKLKPETQRRKRRRVRKIVDRYPDLS